MGDEPRAENLKSTDSFILANEFALRYVARPEDGSVSLYYLNNRIDLTYDALPFIEPMLKTSNFSAQSTKRWLGDEFQWHDVNPLLQELVQAGMLHVDRNSERNKKSRLRGRP